MQWVPTDRTWKEELEGLTPEERRIRRLDLGFEFAVQKRKDGTWRMGWLLPDGWREAMPEVAEWRDHHAHTGDVLEIPDMLS